jgi:hypothetical protein
VDTLGFIGAVGFAVVAIVLSLARIGRGREMLERWAARNGLRLIDAEMRWIRRGVFWFGTS